MPNYVPKVRVAHIVIKGGDYDGLELNCSLTVPFRDFIEFQQKRWGEAATLDSQLEAMRWFADTALVSWNYSLTEDGEPLDTSFDNLMTLEPALVLEIVRQWREALTNLDSPLELVSPNGSTSAEVSTATVPQSASPRKQRRRK